MEAFTHTDETFNRYLDGSYPDFCEIYTDGSRKETPELSVAAGVFLKNESKAIAWKLNPQHTVIGAELFAINEALKYIEGNCESSCVVFTDSLSALQIIRGDIKSYRYITDKIKKLFIKLNGNQIVVLHWVKAHNGIAGNEVADRTANLGHKLDRSVLYPLHQEEVSLILKDKLKVAWNDHWKGTENQ